MVVFSEKELEKITDVMDKSINFHDPKEKEYIRMKSMTIKELQEDLAEVLVERTAREWACILSEDATSLRSATSTSGQEVAAGEVFTALAGFCNAAGIDLGKAITRYITWMVNDQ